MRRRIRREWRQPKLVIGLPVAAVVTWVALSFGLVVLMGLAGVPGIEGLATSETSISSQIARQLPDGAAPPGTVPTLPLLTAMGLAAGILAGLTLNGLLAFGEEYGWRQHLWDRLSGLGRKGTVGVLGVMWGVWHAPLILFAGLNYPDARVAGMGAMVLFAVAASWPLDEIRRATGGAVAPAIFHGMVNGTAGVLILGIVGNDLVTPPVGLVGALAMVGTGFVVRSITARGRVPGVEAGVRP
jgi:hypothetical protein